MGCHRERSCKWQRISTESHPRSLALDKFVLCHQGRLSMMFRQLKLVDNRLTGRLETRSTIRGGHYRRSSFERCASADVISNRAKCFDLIS
jgi:hypothetical protein